MTSQPGYKTIAMHLLPNQRKGNQKMKFGQLIKTIPRHF